MKKDIIDLEESRKWLEDYKPAFPIFIAHEDGRKLVSPGMSLRDWFAGMALQGYLASEQLGGETTISQASITAYRYADAMIAEREKSDV